MDKSFIASAFALALPAHFTGFHFVLCMNTVQTSKLWKECKEYYLTDHCDSHKTRKHIFVTSQNPYLFTSIHDYDNFTGCCYLFISTSSCNMNNLSLIRSCSIAFDLTLCTYTYIPSNCHFEFVDSDSRSHF